MHAQTEASGTSTSSPTFQRFQDQRYHKYLNLVETYRPWWGSRCGSSKSGPLGQTSYKHTQISESYSSITISESERFHNYVDQGIEHIIRQVLVITECNRKSQPISITSWLVMIDLVYAVCTYIGRWCRRIGRTRKTSRTPTDPRSSTPA